MSTIFFLFALYSNQNADALPMQNLTALPTDISPSWVVGPSGRGTWALLYSCVFTIVLCAWTSLHLNVPPPNETAPRRWMREAEWVLIALFAPELLAICAIHQWLSARILLSALEVLENLRSARHPKKSKSDPRTRFDMSYAYLVVMGGFAVDVSHLHNTLERVTLTAEGILFFAKLGHYILPSTEAMRSRGKGDYLAKGLVALQVLWICGEAIERKVTGYPLTLLEIHTLGHAVCALILFVLWIPKPSSVQSPIMINAQNIQEPLAYMLLNSNFPSHPGHRQKPFMGTKYAPTPDLGWYGCLDRCYRHILADSQPNADMVSNLKLSFAQSSKIKKETFFKTVHHSEDGKWEDYTFSVIDGIVAPRDSADTVCTLVSGQALPAGLGPMEKFDNHWTGYLLSLSSKDVHGFELAGTFITKQLKNMRNLPTQNPIELSDCNRLVCARINISPPLRRGLVFRAPNFVLSKGIKEYSIAGAMFIVPLAMGGVHLGGFPILFPSPREKLLWEISCYILLGVAGIFGWSLLLLFTRKNLEPRGGIWRKLARVILALPKLCIKVLGRLPDTLLALVVIISWVVIWVMYFSARVYLITESFISLRHVPVGVYQTPERNIMAYVPHL